MPTIMKNIFWLAFVACVISVFLFAAPGIAKDAYVHSAGGQSAKCGTGGGAINYAVGKCQAGVSDATGANVRVDDIPVGIKIFGNDIHYVLGGYSVGGDARNNAVTVVGPGTAGNPLDLSQLRSIKGGMAGAAGAASKNRATIGGKVYFEDLYYIIGADSEGAASGNAVTISDGHFTTTAGGPDLEVDGGKTGIKNAAAAANKIVVNNGTFDGNVWFRGAHTLSDGANAINNGVTINNGVFNGTVYVFGGDIGGKNANAAENEVSISGGTFNKKVRIYGGNAIADNTNARNNAVGLTGGVFKDDVNIYGGGAFNSADGARVDNNSVSISDAAVDGHATIFGGYSDRLNAVLEENNVTINSGAFAMVDMDGASGYADGIVATHNTATVTGGAFEGPLSVFGADVKGDNLLTTNNAVTITAGTFKDFVAVVGARLDGKDSLALRNTVTVTGGKFSTSGGLTVIGLATTKNAIAKDNIVILGPGLNPAQFGSGKVPLYLYGAVVEDTVTHKLSPLAGATGNTLELHVTGLEAATVSGFQAYHFVLPQDFNVGDTVLTVTDNRFNLAPFDDVAVSVAGDGNITTRLDVGDVITLVHADKGVDAGNWQQENGVVTLHGGNALLYEAKLVTDYHNLLATITERTLSPASKVAVEPRIASLGRVIADADFAHDTGMARALQRSDNATGFTLFSGLGDATMTLESGSHIDTSGYSYVVGTAKRFGADHGFMTGLYLQGGHASFDTYNTVALGEVHGAGDASSFGLGLLVHQSWLSNGTGLYVEGGLRAGKIKTNWETTELPAAAAYELNTAYQGISVAGGYVFGLSKYMSLDVLARYGTGTVKGDNANVGADLYSFDTVSSKRITLGAKLSQSFTPHWRGYVRFLVDHEGAGTANATVVGLSTPAPSIKGNTSTYGLGVGYTPSTASPLSLHLGVTGHSGKRKGLTGGLSVSYAF